MDHRRMWRTGSAIGCAGLLAYLAPVPYARAGQLDAGFALSSDYVVYGVTRSRGQPVVQGQLGWTNEKGWSLGTWFSTVDYVAGPGPSRELDFYLSRRWPIGRDFALTTELTQYTFNEPATLPSFDYAEVRAVLSFRGLFELAASVSPDYYGYSHYDGPREQTAMTYGATLNFPATHRFSINLGAGRFDLRRLFGHTYTYWSAGGELEVGRFSLAVSYIGTDGMAKELFGSALTQDRLVATLGMRLP